MKSDTDQKILRLLSEKRRLSYRELSQLLNLSVPTVRKRVESLMLRAPLLPVYGGVEYGDKSDSQAAAFEAIAKEAAKLISEGDAVYLGPGRTVAALCPHLLAYRDLTVFTNSLSVLEALSEAEQITLFSIGGMYQRSNRAFTFPSNYAGDININKAFISATAIDPDIGISHRILANKETAEVVSSNAKKIVFLGTTDKFEVHGPFVVMPMEAVNILISTDDLNPQIVQKIRAKNIEVRLAPFAPRRS